MVTPIRFRVGGVYQERESGGRFIQLLHQENSDWRDRDEQPDHTGVDDPVVRVFPGRTDEGKTAGINGVPVFPIR